MRISIAMLLLSFAFLQSPSIANEEATKNLKPFPAASEGMTRFVIILPHKERGEEDAFRVEIVVGQEILTDGVNNYSLGGGAVDVKDLKGWGFNYYEVTKLGPVRSTLIGVPAGTPQVKKFVAGPSSLIRYNSRLPIVVYVPKDAEVRYRVWKAPAELEKAKNDAGEKKEEKKDK